MGLHQVLDLGEWWEERDGFAASPGWHSHQARSGDRDRSFVDQKIRESLSYARAHPDEAWPYIKSHAQEMADDVIGQHIDTFVNDFSLDVGDDGERAIRFLLEAAVKQQGLSFPQKPDFLER